MIITGFDPGSNKTGWCSLDVRGGGTVPVEATFFEAGIVASEPYELAELLRALKPEVVAIEKLEGFAFGGGKGPGVVSALVASSRVAGMLSGLAYAAQIEAVEMTALVWRKLVIGNASAKDVQIADVVPARVHGWPKRSNAHTRDAGGVALATALRLNGRRPYQLDEGQKIAQ